MPRHESPYLTLKPIGLMFYDAGTSLRVSFRLVLAIFTFCVANSELVQQSPLLPLSSPKNLICVGGSSGMGKAAALQCLKEGGEVLLISRSTEKLALAKEELIAMITVERISAQHDENFDATMGVESIAPSASSSGTGFDGERIQIAALDVSDEDAVQGFAINQLKDAHYDALVISVADRAPHGPMLTLPTEQTRLMLETKVWTAYHCAKHFSPMLHDGGAVVFVAGILNRRPGLNCVPLAMANGALEGLTRSLALEWGPRLRVNCLSPGFCDTERFDHLHPEKKAAMLANTAASLPLQKVGRPVDMGQAIYYLATASFCTGVVLDVDGGHMIRQYATAITDPMRSATNSMSD
jgi:NAD(P)-dependent dehydrogenase (short-subunit alcohol dehydrogenase family)